MRTLQRTKVVGMSGNMICIYNFIVSQCYYAVTVESPWVQISPDIIALHKSVVPYVYIAWST